MPTGAITGYIDVAQLTLYGFWIFLAGLIYYLRSEDKREGYPLQSDRSGRIKVQGFPPIPTPKTFRLPHGGTVSAPRAEMPSGAGNASPSGMWPGAPLVPNGDPMVDGVGPAAYAMRSNSPDLTLEGHNRLAPLRVDAHHSIAVEDADPRGMTVVGADRQAAGVVTDVWIDRSEMVARYLEVEVPTATGPRHVLLPLPLARIHAGRRDVTAVSVMARHFATAPVLANPDAVSLREEDRISAYFASGHMYATPSRGGPLL
jgi:photosynthetic reaction center H subunit